MSWGTAIISHLSQRRGYSAAWLLSMWPREFDDGTEVFAGFWTGKDDRAFTVGGVSRTFYGKQGDIGIPPITYEKGLTPLQYQFRLPLTPEVNAALRGYRTENARFELHGAVFDPTTMGLVGVSESPFIDGFIDGAPIHLGEIGGQSYAGLAVVSSAVVGTVTSAGDKSDAAQRRRNANDRLREFSALGTVPSDPWGGKA